MDAAYVAGILDGEGCLTIGRNKKALTYDARVYVGMTSKALCVLTELHQRFGGSLKKTRGRTEDWEEAWMWTINGKLAAAMLREVAPHMILKQRQGTLLLSVESMKAQAVGKSGRASWTKEMRERAVAMRLSVMDLNRKGPIEVRKPPVPGALFVRDVDGHLMIPRLPDLFDETTWQPWYGPFGNAGISERGGFWTLNTSEWPSADDGYSVCSLSEILESTSPPKYWLSPKAARGILRRAAKRGRTLPKALEAALVSLAAEQTPHKANESGQRAGLAPPSTLEWQSPSSPPPSAADSTATE